MDHDVRAMTGTKAPTPADAVTQAARAAELAAEVANKVADAFGQVRVAACRAELVVRVATALAHEVDPERVARAAMEQIAPARDAGFALVHVPSRAKDELRLMAWSNVPEELLPRILRVPLDAPFLAARAARTGEVQMIEDAARASLDTTETHDLLERTNARSMVSLPLIRLDRLVGVLTFSLLEPHRVTSEELTTLRTVATMVAAALANAISHRSERRLHQQLEAVNRAMVAVHAGLEARQILEIIVEQARTLVDADYAALGTTMEPDRLSETWVSSGVLPGPVHDPTMSSVLQVPVMCRGQAVGTLFLARKPLPPRFSEEDRQAIELLAAHTGAALEQARLRTAVESKHAQLQAILQHAVHGIGFVDAKTGSVLVNPAMEALCGQAISREARLSDLQVGVRRANGAEVSLGERLASRALRGETIQGDEFVLECPDGTCIPVRGSAAPVRGPADQIMGAVVVLEDITTPKELERLREEFAAIVAHDLKNPITSILLQTELLLRDQAGDPVVVPNAVLKGMRRSALRLDAMVKDLLDASRIEAGQLALEPKPLLLPETVSALLETLRPTLGNHPVELRVDGKSQPVLVDPLRLDQILTNLVVNAAKYSPDGAPILVAIGPKNRAVMSIEDRGMGISKDDLPRLFDRFYQAQRARKMKTGLGLGLYITKGLVEAHGGKIWVESTPGAGSKFYLWLPPAKDVQPLGPVPALTRGNGG